MLALCPLIAASDTVVNAIGLGLASIIASVLVGATLSIVMRWLDDTMRIAATLLILAGILALIERAMLAWFYELRESLGVFLPLIVCNIALIRLWQQPLDARRAIFDALKLGTSIALALLLLGIARELVGRGSLLHGAGHAFGAWFAPAELVVFDVDMGFLLAMLPPGAFISLGLLLALRNWALRTT
jgi:Na+-translocating ferredoxin:NAD+ oxidoreductase subunit E